MKTLRVCFVSLTLALTFHLYTPQTAVAGSFSATGSMSTGRSGHSATLMSNGKVLVLGDAVNSAEVYDPATSVWSPTAPMLTARFFAGTATLLPNGQVLVVGGARYPQSQHFPLAACELYDPVAGTWTATGSLITARYAHTATLLTNGMVLVAGGYNTSIGTVTNCEIYNPATSNWTATGSLSTGRNYPTATLLPNGRVLLAAGEDNNGHSSAAAELFDPTTGAWSTINSLNAARSGHSATLLLNGKVLVAGGFNITTGTWLNSAELYDPVSGAWTLSGSFATPRDSQTATLLPNGKLLIAGGESTGISFLASAELYDPVLQTWSAGGSLSVAREGATATMLSGGRILVAGGANSGGAVPNCDLYDPSANPATGAWAATGSLNIARDGFTLNLLPNGRVLAVGGFATNDAPVAIAELYDPSNATWTATAPLNSPRSDHTATLLANGRLLVTGGFNFPSSTFLSGAELYDPVSQTWANTGSMGTVRFNHTTILLANGKVLAVGGGNAQTNALASAELYDPVYGTWTATGSLNTPRASAPAFLLPNGMVIIAGGSSNNSVLSSAELYNPATGLWTTTGSMSAMRVYHTMTLLPNGLVLVAGGQNTTNTLSSAELYNPASGLWSPTGPMTVVRASHRAVLLPNGKVLVIGNSFGAQSSELYDPAGGTWTLSGPMVNLRANFEATLLPNGKVLVAGGYSSGTLSSAELYDVGQGFSPSSQPQITTVNSPLNPGDSLVLAGSKFRGLSEGSGGSAGSSPADYPLVQLRSVESGQTLLLPTTNWSANSFTSTPVNGFPSGYALATVFVNGIPSPSAILQVFSETQITVTLGNLSQTYDGTAKSVSVTTSPGLPANVTVNVTYNGSANAPTNAGSYAVIAAVNDPYSEFQGFATNTLVIAPAPASITLGNLLQSYDGTAKSVSVITAPPGLPVSVSYNGVFFTPINAGTYNVIATIISNPNYEGGATNTLTIINGLTLDTSQTLRTVDPRWYGLNTAIWDSNFDTDSTSNTLKELACRTLRFPGGSLSDFYHWETGTRDDGYQYDPTRFSNFMHVATNAGVNVYITVNYGTGTTNEAADWVRSANNTNLCGFKYWEVGNECYGSWEADNNTNPPYAAHDPWTYAMRFKDYYTAMKAADPTIKIGIMVTPFEDSYGSGTNFAINPRTGVPHYGWTPVLLATLQSLGVTPDFAVHHVYPEYQNDNDALLLQAASNWAGDAADLRQQISDYFGPTGTNIELVCTENNADAGPQGRQSTSLVNGLYLADSMSQIARTEFNSYVWWDLRNGVDGVDVGGDFDPSLYGWRTNGDLGIMLGTDTRYPTYYAMKLMQYFAQPGDTILNANTSDALLSVYAARKTDGAVSVLVINKDPSNTLTRPIVLAGFTPNSVATIRSFGISQDEATRTNSTVPGAQDIATNNFPTAGAQFSYAFPPYSLTLFTLSPAAPALLVMPPSGQTNNTFVFQLQGQPGNKYILQTSTDLAHWTPTVTNILATGVVNVTNPIPPGNPQQFWRVLWQP